MLEAERLPLPITQGPEILAQAKHLPRVRPEQAGERGQERRLAAAGRTHEKSELTSVKIKGHILQGGSTNFAATETAADFASS